MKISVIGAGYVGLVTGACLADLGHDVLCMDDNREKIALLKAGGMPIYESGLSELVRINVDEERLRFSTNIKEAIDFAPLIFICVGTPPKENGEADLSAVEWVGNRIGEQIKAYKLIVEKSTVPVQTAEWLGKTIRAATPNPVEFDIASNPEFLREGSAIQDFMHPDRIVLGVPNQKAASTLVELYQPLNAPFLVTDIKSAELIKHSSNAFLAMKISFINAISQICEKTGADVAKVAKGIGLDERIGAAFLNAGIGYGGACFPKDLAAFVHLADQVGYDFKLLKAVADINEVQRQFPVQRIREILGSLQDKVIGLWGLSFKPQTDDLRGSGAVDIIRTLLKEKARVKVFDPVAMENAKTEFPSIHYAKNPYDAAEGCDALILATEWPLFKHLNFLKIKQSMRRALFLDGRNMHDPSRMAGLGFEYISVGRPTPNFSTVQELT